MKIKKPKPSEVAKFRNKYLKKGIELINISALCEYKLGISGSCNDFNEPDETIHHVQIWYRDEIVGNMNGVCISIIDEDKYVYLNTKQYACGEDDIDFIIFKKCYNGIKNSNKRKS